jgi:hypothetical protein
MDPQRKNAYLTRDAVLRLLSDEEIANVSMAQTAPHLSAGDEYLDLAQIDDGVQFTLARASFLTCAGAPSTPMSHVLPRKSVRELTWYRILNVLLHSRRRLPPAGS